MRFLRSEAGAKAIGNAACPECDGRSRVKVQLGHDEMF